MTRATFVCMCIFCFVVGLFTGALVYGQVPSDQSRLPGAGGQR